MVNKLFPIFLMFSIFGVSAQKNTQEIILSEGIEVLEIEMDEVYLLKINSQKDANKIRISTHSEGEYLNDINLESFIEGNTLKLKSQYKEILSGGYDKLSAHKVFAVDVEISLPEHLIVSVRSNIASVIARGKYNSFIVELKQGYCHLLDFEGSAVINTYTGDILVETSSGLLEANTRNGKLKLPEFLPGRNPLRLTSIDGDIIVRKN